MKFGDYPKAGSLDGVTGFRNYVQSLGLDMGDPRGRWD